jgi:alcohol dehydrogenase class IV
MHDTVPDFFFRCPTRLEFGAGKLAAIGDMALSLGLRSVLLVTGTGATKNSSGYARLKEALRKAGVDFSEYAAVTADPEAALVREAAKLAQEGKRQGFIAYGGGSPIDCAKSAALMAANGLDVLDFIYGRAVPGKPALPLIAVPTTAGTGSEMSSAAVTTDGATKRKLGFSHESFFPAVALVDPELHTSMPPAVSAATGMDALTHAVESFLSLGANPASDAINLQCVELIGRNLERSCSHGEELGPRSGMAIAAALAGAAFSNTGLGMVHGFAHPVGARYGAAHGLANAVILPYVLAAMASSCPGRMARLGEAFSSASGALRPDGAARQADGGHAADSRGYRDGQKDGLTGARAFVADIAALKQRLGIPASLAELGIAEDQLAAILPDALSYRMRQRSPRAFSDAELGALLRAAWSGSLSAAEQL